MRLPSVVKEISRIFGKHGYELYLVGGTVRDRILKRNTDKLDFDLATNASPKDVMKMFRRVIPTGIDHGTVTVLFRRCSFEITTFRTESAYSDHRHPDDVAFASTIYEDISRRDFTINSLAVNAFTGELLDTQNGLADLKSKTIRCIGDAKTRFSEDALRMLRGCRFASQLQFQIEPDTFSAMQDQAKLIRSVSAERIKDELNGILSSDTPSAGLEYMRSGGLMEHIIPELLEGRGVSQEGNQRYDVYYHSIYSCDGAGRDNLNLRWAALLHDIGKPAAKAEDAFGNIIFHGHEKMSCDTAGTILSRLRFANRDKDRILRLISLHMFNYTDAWSDSAVRRFLAQAGYDLVEDLFKLRYADQYGTFGHHLRYDSLLNFKKRIEEVKQQHSALSVRDLAVDGNDLMKDLSLQPGKHIGILLNALLEAVLDDPELNQRETLLTIARSYYQEYLAKDH